MCLLPTTEKMKLLSPSVAQKLQGYIQRQNAFRKTQNLRDKSAETFAQHMDVRSACVQYIKVPHVFFGTKPDTFATAVGILDVFLWKVKVSERYMSVVSMSCFCIAAKLLESEDVCPTGHQLASFHFWSVNDLSRMELAIMGKLDWSVTQVTYLNFLPLMAEVYGISAEFVCSDAVVALAERCLCRQTTVLMDPAVMALALLYNITCEVLAAPAEHQLMVHCNIQEDELNSCRKLLSAISSSSSSSSTSPWGSSTRLRFPMKIFDKPSEMGITCLPTIVEEPAA